MAKCTKNCEVYSRIVGYFRPVKNWNLGKKEEFKERMTYEEEKAIKSPMTSSPQVKAHI
jgi:hypothetical protein